MAQTTRHGATALITGRTWFGLAYARTYFHGQPAHRYYGLTVRAALLRLNAAVERDA